MTLHMMGFLAAMAVAAQDPGEILGGWDSKPEKAIKAEDLNAEAADESRLLQAVVAAEKLGADHLLLAPPLEELGVYYMIRKRSADAEPLLRRALAIRERNQGPEHVDVAETLVNLAMCRLVAKGKAAKGRDPDTVGLMLRRALMILERRGKDDPEVARTLHAMAMSYLFRGEFDPAEAAMMRALAIREKTSGPESTETASVLDDLGDLHTAQCQPTFDEKIEAMEAEIKGRPKGESRAERHGKKADECYRRALAIRERILQPDDPHIAETLYNLGQLATFRDRPADAEKYLERWLKLQENTKAPASERMAAVLMMLAGSPMEHKDWARAEDLLSRMQTIVTKLHGAESAEVSMALSARAMVALKARRFDDAESLLKRGLEVQAAILGPDDPDIVRARDLIARSYRDHVNDRRAPVLWHRLKVFRRQAGREHKHDVLGHIADIYVDLLRRTNSVVPHPTEADLAALKKAGVVLPMVELDDLACEDSVLDYNLDDARLAHIARMYQLEELRLHGDKRRITDAGLSHVKDLINLSYLRLTETDISDAGLTHLRGLDNLETLILMSTRVSDAGLVHLKGLKNLQELDLAFTNVTDTGLKHLEGLASLRSLDLRYTTVTEAVVDRLRRARPELDIKYKPGTGFFRPTPLPGGLGVPPPGPVPYGVPAPPPPGVDFPAGPAPEAPLQPPTRPRKP